MSPYHFDDYDTLIENFMDHVEQYRQQVLKISFLTLICVFLLLHCQG